jgi:hypothetical protein
MEGYFMMSTFLARKIFSSFLIGIALLQTGHTTNTMSRDVRNRLRAPNDEQQQILGHAALAARVARPAQEAHRVNPQLAGEIEAIPQDLPVVIGITAIGFLCLRHAVYTINDIWSYCYPPTV